MKTNRVRKNILIKWSFVSITILAIWLNGISVFSAETISFKGTTKSANGDFITLTGKLSKPEGKGPFPALVLLHGSTGIQKGQDDWADRLVTWGYVALQVKSFGSRGVQEAEDKLIQIPPQFRTQDAYDARAYLGELSFVDRNRIAVMGWSHGGITTLCLVSILNYASWAGHRPQKQEDPFRAAIAFYPFCKAELDDFNTPLLILAGDKDTTCPASFCKSMMPSGKSKHDIILIIFPGAYHGFDYVGVEMVRKRGRLLYNPEITSCLNCSR